MSNKDKVSLMKRLTMMNKSPQKTKGGSSVNKNDNSPPNKVNSKVVKKLKTLRHLNTSYNKRKSFKQSIPFHFFKKKITSVSDIQNINDNINIITSYFLDNHPDHDRTRLFLNTYEPFLSGSLVDILLLIKFFPDFNIFDFLLVSTHLSEHYTPKELETKTTMISIRNNILMSIIVVAKELELCEKEGEIDFGQPELLFEDLRFLNPLIEKFKNIIIDCDSKFTVNFDVELFFFTILGYKDKARIIKQKYNQYFKDLLLNSNIQTLTINDFLNITLEKEHFINLSDEEILLFRKILDNAAKRDFYFGIEYLMKDAEFCFFFSEGRIWKDIGIHMEAFQVFNLWSIYEDSIDQIRNMDVRETLAIEYDERIRKINIEINTIKEKYKSNPDMLFIDEEYNKLIYNKKTLLKEIHLYSVSCLKELFVIFFRYELKALVLFFFDEYKNNRGYHKVPLDIYEICLDYDEDISIDIIDRALTHSNIKRWYMDFAIIKKYFRLARNLLKFQLCKKCLDEQSQDDSDYFLFVSKMQIQQKKRLFEKTKYGGELNEDVRIIDFIQEKNTLEGDADSERNIKNENDNNNNNNNGSMFDNNNKRRNRRATKLSLIQQLETAIEQSGIKHGKIFKSVRPKQSKKMLSFFDKKSSKEYDNKEEIRVRKSKFGNIINNNNISNNRSSMILLDNKSKFMFSSSLSKIESSSRSTPRSNLDKTSESKLKDDSSMNKIIDSSNNTSNIDENSNINNTHKTNEKRSPMIAPNKLLSMNKLDLLNLKFNIANHKDTTFTNDDNSNSNNKKNRKMSVDNNINNNRNPNYLANPYSNNSNHLFHYSKVKLTELAPSNKKSVITNKNNYNNNMHLSPHNISNNDESYTVTSRNSVLTSTSLLTPNINNENLQNKTHSLSSMNNNDTEEDDALFKSKSEEVILQKIKAGKMTLNIQLILIEHLRVPQHCFDVLCLLSSIPEKKLNPLYYDRICMYLTVYTNNESAITKTSHPLLLLALAGELLLKIGKINSKIANRAGSVCQDLLKLAEFLQSSMKDEDMLHYYLREQSDHLGRSALEIYAENKFFNVLSDMNVGALVSKLWYGSGNEQSLSMFFRITRILKADIFSEHYQPMVQNNYLPKNSVFSFQFYQYTKNCSIRNFFESASVLIITLLYQYIIYAYVTFTKENVNHPITHHYYIVTFCTNVCVYLSLIHYISTLVYFHKTGRKLKINKSEAVINVIMFIAITCNFFNIPEKLAPVEKYPDTNILGDGIIYSIILTMGWMKVVVILMTTNSYGPFLRIMFNIFWSVLLFLIIFFCITFLFAQCFVLFFQPSNIQFFEFYEGFVTLFNTAFGQVNFHNFYEMDVFGVIALMVYTGISNLILFNLIVAIINNLFNEFQEQADAESRAMLVLTFERIKWDDRYGLLIMLPAPINILSLFFIPILFFIKDNIEFYNMLFAKISYFFVALFIFLLMIIVLLLCYPFALVKALCHSTLELWTFGAQNKCKTITISFLIRPYVLLWYMIYDLWLFWKVLYKEPNTYSDEDEEHFTSIRKYIIALRKILNDIRFKEKKSVVHVKELYKKLSLFKKRKRTKNNNNNNHSTLSTIDITKNVFKEDDNNTTNTNTNNNKKGLNSESSDGERIINDDYSSNTKHMLYSNNSNNQQKETFFDTEKKQKSLIKEEMKISFRKLLDKVIDPEGYIDIERSLLILPDRVKYSESFIRNLKFMSVRVFIRGLTKFFFDSEAETSLYNFKKIELLIYKLLSKLKVVYTFLPEYTLLNINQDFALINNNRQFEKSAEALQRYDEIDGVSEYDDEGEFVDENDFKQTGGNSTLKPMMKEINVSETEISQ